MPHKPLPFIKTVVRRGKVYEYFRTGLKVDGKEKLNPLPARSDKAFGQVYGGMLAGRSARAGKDATVTLADVCISYQKGKKWERLADNTKRVYVRAIDRIVDQMGDAPIDELEAVDLRSLLNKLSETPATANLALAVMRNLFKFAMHQGLMKTDPTVGIEELETDEVAYEPWPEPLLEEALADAVFQLPVALLYYTAQRIGDVCKMRWTDYRDGHMYVKQQKTGKELDLKVHRDLAAILDAAPRTAMTIIENGKGMPLTPSAFRSRVQKWARARGHDVVVHGLRKNAVIALLEAGCTIAETSSMSGQTLGMVEHYARQRDNRRISDAAVLKWEGTAREHGKQWKTGGATRA